MKMQKARRSKVGFWVLAAAAVVLAIKAPAQAATSFSLDIKVSINATKALTVGSTHYNFGALAVNTSSVSATAVLVTNTSGALLQTYTLQGANAASTGGGTTS